jgi:hypothetical protein
MYISKTISAKDSPECGRPNAGKLETLIISGRRSRISVSSTSRPVRGLTFLGKYGPTLKGVDVAVGEGVRLGDGLRVEVIFTVGVAATVGAIVSDTAIVKASVFSPSSISTDG